MAIYSSNESVKKNALQSKATDEPLSKKKLTSCLFKKNQQLQKIYAGKGKVLQYSQSPETVYNQTINPETGQVVKDGIQYVKFNNNSSTGDDVVAFTKALSVVFPAIKKRTANTSNPAFQSYNKNDKIITDKFNLTTDLYVRQFQEYAGINVDGIVGKDTLEALDKILNEIKYYDCETGEIFHDASVCEDKFTVTVATVTANVHSKPSIFSPTVTTLDPSDPLNRKVYIIQDISNYNPGWLFVQFDTPRQTSSNPEPKSTFGYVNSTKIWTKSSMPDGKAELYKVVSGDTVYQIISNTYYTNNGLNDFDYQIRTNEGLSPTDLKEYNFFKFYVNLLLVANNPNRIYSAGEAIYLDYNGAVPINLDDIDNINPFDNNSSTPNYDYFLEELKLNNPNYDWQTWEGDETINLISGLYIWIPSKHFADRLYAYINYRSDYLNQLNNDLRDLIKDNWDRGYGIEIEGSVGATFGIPIHLEGGGSVHLYRKYTVNDDEIVMCLRKYGRLQVGLDTGIGPSFHLGSGKKGRSGYELAAELGAQFEAGAELEIFTEYEFVFWKDTDFLNAGRKDLAALALFVSLLDIGVGAIEFAAVQFAKAFTDYNIDPMNYLTRFEASMTGFVRGSAGGMIGLKMGNQDSVDFWNSNNPSGSHKDPPWHLKKILGLMNSSLNVSAGIEMSSGFEYTAEYDEKCFDKKTGSRVPKTFSLSMNSDFTYLSNASANIGTISLINFASSPFLGLKLILTYDRPDLTDPTTPEEIVFIPNKNNLKYDKKPKIEVYSGYGSWDFYENSASNYGIRLKLPLSIPTSASSLINQIDYIYIKKRYSLINFSQSAIQNAFTLQQQIRNFFQKSRYKKFGFGAGAFLDFEARLNQSSITTFITNLSSLITELRIEISNKQGVPINNIDWWQVLIELPLYISTFTSPKVSAKFKKLFFDLLNGMEITNFSFHGDLSFGGSMGFKFGAGLKGALNAQAILSITYDQQFIKNDQVILPDDQIALVNELKGYLDNDKLKQALLIFSEDQVNFI